MDGLTAIGFAREAFDKLHPGETVPKDFWRFAGGTSLQRDMEQNYIVHFGWQLKASDHGADAFFKAHVNAWTGETTVLLDTPLDKYRQDELEEYL